MQETNIPRTSIHDVDPTSPPARSHRALLLHELPDDAMVTTREAAELCGFKTPSAIRKACLEGRLRPVCKRGGRGTWMWRVSDLRRFINGLPPVPDAE